MTPALSVQRLLPAVIVFAVMGCNYEVRHASKSAPESQKQTPSSHPTVGLSSDERRSEEVIDLLREISRLEAMLQTEMPTADILSQLVEIKAASRLINSLWPGYIDEKARYHLGLAITGWELSAKIDTSKSNEGGYVERGVGSNMELYALLNQYLEGNPFDVKIMKEKPGDGYDFSPIRKPGNRQGLLRIAQGYYERAKPELMRIVHYGSENSTPR